MQCYNCQARKTRTIYPKDGKTQFVQKVCDVCGWKSYPIKVIKFE